MYFFKWEGGERAKEREENGIEVILERYPHCRWPSKFRFLKKMTLFKEIEFRIKLFTLYLSLYIHIPGIHDIWRSLNHFLPSGMHQPREGYGLGSDSLPILSSLPAIPFKVMATGTRKGVPATEKPPANYMSTCLSRKKVHLPRISPFPKCAFLTSLCH